MKVQANSLSKTQACTLDTYQKQLKRSCMEQRFHSTCQAEEAYKDYFSQLCNMAEFYKQAFTEGLFISTFEGWTFDLDRNFYANQGYYVRFKDTKNIEVGKYCRASYKVIFTKEHVSNLDEFITLALLNNIDLFYKPSILSNYE